MKVLPLSMCLSLALYAVAAFAGSPAADQGFAGHIANSSRDSTPWWPTKMRAATDAPNVLLILLDDTGFADFGAYGSEIDTPNIDLLANNGLRYNHFTTTAVCSPSRAALLTGLNHHSAGVGWLANMDSGYPGYRGEIHADAITLPEVLRANGYNTMMVGKWHLTNSSHLSAVGPYDSWPLQRGFERFWGVLDGEASQWNPALLYQGNAVIETPTDGDFYLPDAMAAQAIQMLKDQRATSRSTPFFLYYASMATHAPHHTRAADRDKYRGAFDQGYDAIRRQRLQRQKAVGLVPPNTKLAPYYPGVKPWADLSANEKKVSARLQENYAAYLDSTDQQIGKLLDYLRAVGELDNTLIILSSDNGASRETGTVGTTMATRYLHGIADTTEKNLEDFDKIGGPESHPNYPHGWMQASNTPFKYSKASTHGGGVRDPLIIHWPAGFSSRGELRNQFHHINDLMPTVLEVVGVEQPKQFRGMPTRPMEGISMVYSFDSSDTPSRKREQYYELEANRAYVADGWKIVTRIQPGQRYDAVPWELYDLRSDFSETQDLSRLNPGKVTELEEKWWQAARRYQVLPIHDQPIMQRGRQAMARLENIHYQEFEYQPGINTVHTVQAPILTGSSFSVSAHIDRKSPEQGGVIAAMGGYDVGYTFFLKDNYLYYEVNIGGYRTQLRSERVLPLGPLNVSARFVREKVSAATAGHNAVETDGNFSRHELPGGELQLLIEGVAVGKAHFAPPVPFNTWEGLDIGRDSHTAVSQDYQAPFEFQGQLDYVRYRIEK